MKTLVWVEHDGASVKDATLSAVTAAAKLGEVHLLVAGSGVDGVAKAAAGIAGVTKVHVADNAAFGHNLPENIAPVIADLMGHHDAFVAPLLKRQRRPVAAPRSKPLVRAAMPGFRALSAARLPSPNAPNSPRPKSSSRVAER